MDCDPKQRSQSFRLVMPPRVYLYYSSHELADSIWIEEQNPGLKTKREQDNGNMFQQLILRLILELYVW